MKQDKKNGKRELPLGVNPSVQTSDPELTAVLSHFVNEETLPHVKLDPQVQNMVLLSALIALQAKEAYRYALETALKEGLAPAVVKEIVYQAVPYVGMAKVLDLLDITNQVFTTWGISFPLEGHSTTTKETRLEKGLDVQKSIFGAVIDKMYESSPKDQLCIQTFLSANCFGDYYTRTGLSVPVRELLTFSMLSALGGCEPQLKGHIQGNVKVGNGKETLFGVVVMLLPYIGYPRSLNAIRCLNEELPD